MPLARYAVYRGGPQIWVAPTADDSDGWLASMRHVAIESGAFVVSVPQYIPEAPRSGDFLGPVERDRVYGRCGAAIVEPTGGEVIAGPLYDEEGILVADCDLRTGLHAKRWFDAVGHYSREDVLFPPATASDDVVESVAAGRGGAATERCRCHRAVRAGAPAVGGVDASPNQRSGVGVGAMVTDRVGRGRGPSRTPRSPSAWRPIARGPRSGIAVCPAAPGRADGRAAARAAPRTITDEQVDAVIIKTLESTPRTPRTGRRARWPRTVGLTQTAVSRIWRAFGLQPAPPGRLQAHPRPAVRRQSPRRRRALSQPARAGRRALRR